jgi:hypothetical protein
MSQLWDNTAYFDFDVHEQVNVNKYIHSKSTRLHTFKDIRLYTTKTKEIILDFRKSRADGSAFPSTSTVTV